MLGIASLPGDHVHHPEEKADDLVLVFVLQSGQDRRNRRGPEVDERLRRHFGGVGMIEVIDDLRKRGVVARPPEELEDECLDLALRRRPEVLDQRGDLLRGKDSRKRDWMSWRSATSTMRGLLVSAIRTSARSAVRFSFSSSEMIRRRKFTVPTSAIFPIGFEHRLAQRFLGVEREDGRQRGAVADLAQRFDDVELEPEIAARAERAHEGRQRRGVAVFPERRNDRRGDVDVALFLEELDEDVEPFGAAQISDEVHERETNVHVDVVASRSKAPHDRLNRRLADADQRLGGGIALPCVLGIGKGAQEDHR